MLSQYSNETADAKYSNNIYHQSIILCVTHCGV